MKSCIWSRSCSSGRPQSCGTDYVDEVLLCAELYLRLLGLFLCLTQAATASIGSLRKRIFISGLTRKPKALSACPLRSGSFIHA